MGKDVRASNVSQTPKSTRAWQKMPLPLDRIPMKTRDVQACQLQKGFSNKKRAISLHLTPTSSIDLHTFLCCFQWPV
jgi:hypothetical protein